jgi:uncharacterized spore protein YtfJ
MTDTPVRPVDAAGDRVVDGVASMLDASAARVYADPVQIGDRVVITAAAFESAGGFGYGAATEGDGDGGGGGGGYGNGRPVAVIEAGPDGVRVRPVIDLTRIGVTLVAAALTVWRATRR